jgi:hypothetical protein
MVNVFILQVLQLIQGFSAKWAWWSDVLFSCISFVIHDAVKACNELVHFCIDVITNVNLLSASTYRITDLKLSKPEIIG